MSAAPPIPGPRGLQRSQLATMTATATARDQILRAIGDPLDTLSGIGPGHPELEEAQLLRAAVGIIAKSHAAFPAIAEALRRVPAPGASPRACTHVAAAQAWLDGEPVATIATSCGGRARATLCVALTSGGSMFFEPVPTLADVLAAPAGHYHFGRDHLVWGAVPGLSGAIQWGAIDDRAVADTRAMLELLGSAGGAVLLDWRGILRVDGEALLAVTPRAQAEGRVTLLVPPGLPGMLLAGAAVAYAPTLAQSHAAAVAALAHPQAAEAVAAAEDRAFELRARTGSEVIERVRAKLRRELAGTTLALCATSVGCSPRTLQRILEAHGTTFSAELRSARVAAATELLAYTDTKIDAIAARTGFASSSRLSATLRRELHVTAGELRARVRRPSRCRPVASRPAIGAPHDHA